MLSRADCRRAGNVSRITLLRGAATLALGAAWALALGLLALSPGLLIAALAGTITVAAILILLITLGPQRHKSDGGPAVGREFQSLTIGGRASPPRYETLLLGRDTEIAAVIALLGMEQTVTLLGPPGVGKTHLAAEIARRFEVGLQDRSCWVDLAPVSDDRLLLKTIAGGLGLWDGVDLDGIVRFLSDKQMLLVLDNMEQLKVGAPILRGILARCPRVRILATSRDVVFQHGQTYPVDPLPVALDDGRENATPSTSANVFMARARRRDAALQFSPKDLTAIEEICILLAGLPLPIELAAGRVPTLTPVGVLDSLRAGRSVLRSNDPDEDVRHRTMEEAVRWSDNLLSPAERLLFRRAAVLDGGLSQTAAAAISGEQPDEALALVEALVDASLLSPMADAPLEPRYRMLEPIRQAAFRLLADDREGAERLRFEYCLELAQKGPKGLGNRQALEWAAAFEVEQPNIRGALSWAVDTDPNGALELAVVMFQFWNLHGHIKEGLGWLEQTLAAAPSPSPRLRARAQNRIASLARLSGETEKARTLYRKVLAWTTEEDDPWDRSFAFNGLGHLELNEDDPEAARLNFETSLRIRAAYPNFYGGTAVTLTNLGDLAQYYDHDLASARHFHEQSLAIRIEHDDLPGIPISRLKLAGVDVAQERLDAASSKLAEAVGAFTELGDRKWLASCLELAAEIALIRLGPAAAARACGAAEALRETLGTVRTPFEARAFERVASQARLALRGDFLAAVSAGRKSPIAAVFDQVLRSGNE